VKDHRFLGPARFGLFFILGMMLARPALTGAGTGAFMKIQGVDGESNDRDHEKWIIIESFSWGVARTSSAAAPGDITITKAVDRASPKLAEYRAKGSGFPEVIVDTPRTDGKPGYITYTLKNVKIVSITPGGGGKTEKIKLAYQSRQTSSSR
jgi:type VI secretion system secreted protein Hcp